MESRSKDLFKNTSILTISNFSSKILVFILVPLYTNVLTTAEYGTYDLIMSTIQVFIPFLTLNIVDGVLRFIMDKNVNTNDVKLIGLKYIVCSIVGMALILCINHFFEFWCGLKQYEVYTLLYFSFYVFNQLFIQTAKGQEKIKELGIAGVISTLVSLLMNILLLVIIPLGLPGFFISYILGQATSAIYLCITTSFFKKLEFNVNKTLQKEMLTYSIPLIFGTLGWLINNVSDRYVVTWLCGVDENGIYSISYKIPTILTTVQNIFIQAWTISAIKEYNSNTRDSFYRKMFFYLNFIMVITCSCLIFGTKIIAKFLYAKDFYIAWKYVPFLLLSVVIGASSGYIGPILSAKKDSKSIAKSTLYGAIVNLVLNLILIYMIGTQGAAIATAVSNILIYYIRRKAIGKILFEKEYLYVMLSWVILAIQATLMINDFSILIQIPFIIALVVIYRKSIVAFIQKIILCKIHK